MGVSRFSSCAWVAGITACVFTGSASGISFSFDGLSPEWTVGVQGVAGAGILAPGDIFTPLASYGPIATPVAPPGLLVINLPGEINALSYGRAPASFNANDWANFSLDRGAAGLAGTASANEFSFGAGVSEQSSDVFRSVFNNTNTIFADGDGVVQAGNPNPAAFPLGTGEFATFPFPPQPPIPPSGGADLDALDLRFNTNAQGGSPTGTIFMSVDASTAGGLGFSAGDVLVDPSGLGTATPAFYASDAVLGLLPGGNDIDALVVYDDGDNVYLPGTDIVLFSLAPGSSYLGQLDPISGLAINEGDILIDGTSAQLLLGSLSPNAAILHTAESLGLRTTRAGFAGNDNLNALDVPEPAAFMVLSCMTLTVLRRRTA
jgi:hypothetical protein